MSDNTLFQNMEILREKFKITYKEAKEVLELNNNDLIESLIFLEESDYAKNCCPMKSYLEDIKKKLVELYKEGSNQRLIISRKGSVIADIPLTAVVISSFVFVLYPILIPLKLGGILLFDIDFKVVDKTGKVYHVNSDVKEKVTFAFSTSKDKINSVISNVDIKVSADEFKNKAVEFGKKAMENFNEMIENKISKNIKNKTESYAKFVYDAEKDEIEEEFNNINAEVQDFQESDTEKVEDNKEVDTENIKDSEEIQNDSENYEKELDN